MPRLHLIAFLVAALSTPVLAQNQTDADRAAIRAISDAWEDAARTGDPDAVTALYTEDGIIQPAGEPPVRGREALAAYFADGFREPFDITLTTDFVVISDARDMAYEFGTSFEGQGKFMVVYRRVDGQWLIAADSWSWNSPRAASND